jgi:ABC-type multidrug transport system ATPase subunit
MTTIEARGLTKRFGDHLAVADLTFDVQQGEIVGLLGRNGSGKTTTVRMLTTLTRPTSGGASIAGYDIETQIAAVRRHIGVALQEPTLDPTMTGHEHLALVGRMLGIPSAQARARTLALLDGFGLAEQADRLIGTYSGGTQRRLDLATALFARPPVLFLDEPTTGLDPQSRRGLWDEVLRLRDAGATILLTTQYLEEADQLADRILVIDDGSILTQGSPAELRRRHGVRTVVVSGEHRILDVGDGVFESVLVTDGTTTIKIAPGIGNDMVLETLRRGLGTLDHVESIAAASLEEVFVHLTNGHGTALADTGAPA